MKRLGNFAEFGEPGGRPSISTALDPDMPRRLRGLVAMYLVQGGVLRYTMGRQPDVLDGEEVYLSAGLRTDGTWYWRCDLAHYVLKYGISLPPAFIRHAELDAWNPAVLTEEELGQVARRLRAAGDAGTGGA